MSYFNFSPKIEAAANKAKGRITEQFSSIEENTRYNQQKVLSAFINNGVSERYFAESTGYGYGDMGREVLDSCFAEAFSAEAALVRSYFTCGTHTLSTALFGLLRPGDIMLSVMGTPYDTIRPVIGISGSGMGSLKDFGITYKEVELKNAKPDLEKIEEAVKKEKIKLVYIQRSRGYTLRPSLSVEEIGEIAAVVKKNSDAIVMVDNCYGEFVQRSEPLSHGADIMAGSLIKNPGGGVAKNGGYIAGKKELVELCAYRLTCPGLGAEVGASLGHNREMFMGLFHSPHVVGEALKTAVFTSALFEELGFETTPTSTQERYDIIQSLLLETPERLINFCRGLQSGAPVDSMVTPEPWDMPGYDNKVIMAAGTFTLGSSIELSADAPLREPFAVWLQGGLNFHSSELAVMLAAQKACGND